MQEEQVIFTADIWPQDRWPNFACSETGECAMDRLQLLRYPRWPPSDDHYRLQSPGA